MWANHSLNPPYFQFTEFSDFGPLKILFFCLCLLVFVAIALANGAIVLCVFFQKSLHRPMYIFICSLALNSLYVSTAFFPRFLYDILSDIHFISRTSCLTQMYVIHTYKAQEITILTIMAYDRFVAIFYPLNYSTKMSLRVVGYLLLGAFLYPIFIFGVLFVPTVRLPLCGTKLHKMFCHVWGVLELSCVDTTHIHISGNIVATPTIFVPLGFVLFTYLRILLLCRRRSSDFRKKALNTCLPHIVTLMNFCTTVFIDLCMNLYEMGEVNTFVVAVLSLEFLIVPPVSNPLVYGLNLPQIRAVIFSRIKIRRIVTKPPHTSKDVKVTPGNCRKCC